ncbi:PREDICTED: mitotic spindle assembly checkpoint protein MAD2A isoform X1 [Bison bison bison]|uniref:Mitotic spindle assembly checkpoint protein MAD2A n=1 Tax=Bison bison bison TaxID=43346 RepID=A0A6P3H7P0_BISBB|nr:PREDICTED: mitotic spindle assembly checkpoint protein MAD2A isoform X1 [Bison bison bison]
MGRRAPPPLVLLPAEEAARALQGPALWGAPLRERFFPMQSSAHTPGPQRRGASRVDRDGLDFRKSCSELGQVYLLTEPGKTAFGINSILYQRGIYPSETFTRVQKYGLTLLVTTDPELIKYLNNVVDQLKEWLYKCSVQKLVVVISNIESGEVLERWQFDIECDKTAKDDSAPREKSQKAIQDEIRSVIRQITATVTFLPLLEVSCSFDLLIYTDKDLVVPEKWEESGPQFITNSEEVRLRSFTTTIHKVNSMVAYKIPVND